MIRRMINLSRQAEPIDPQRFGSVIQLFFYTRQRDQVDLVDSLNCDLHFFARLLNSPIQHGIFL